MKKIILLAGLICALTQALFAGETVYNGGFELGAAGWNLSSNAQVSGIYPHHGTNCLAMNCVSNQFLTNFASISVPPIAQELVLTYFYKVTRTDGSTNYDSQMLVQLAGPTGVALVTNAIIPNSTADGLWYSQQVNLTPYKGYGSGNLQIQFVVYSLAATNGTTTFSVDDVSAYAVMSSDQPVNDNFAGRTVLPSTNYYSVGSSNIYASWELGETNHCGKGPSGGASVWWSYTPPTNGTVTIDTSTSSFNTILAVYTGDAIGELTLVASNNDIGNGNVCSRVHFPGHAGTAYNIVVDGTNGQMGTIVMNLSLSLDTTVPTVAIAYPGSGATVSNSTISARGTAKDNIGVGEIDYRLVNVLGASDWTNSASSTNAYTNWTAMLTGLTPGTNTLQVRSVDQNGNVSKVASSTFNYVVTDTLHLAATGLGSVTAGYSNSLRQINKSYSITATPAKNWILSNWTASWYGQPEFQMTNATKLTFAMRTNMTLSANFVTNPFTWTGGSYAGLFTNADIEFTNSGYFSASLTSQGKLSAKLQLGGASYSLSGPVSAGGWYSNAIARKGLPPLVVQLQVDLSGGNAVTGLVTCASWTNSSLLWADRAVYSKTAHAPQAGNKYTLAMQGSGNVTNAPGNFSAGALGVDVSGNISFSGTLSDGTKATQKAVVSQHNQWPLYLALYSGKGAVLGWLSVSNTPDTNAVGQVSWLKPASTAKLYPAFNLSGDLDVFLSSYTYLKGVPVLSNLVNPAVILEDGNLPDGGVLINGFTLNTNSVATATNKLSLKFTTASGLFQGSVPRLVKTSTISIHGAVLQNRNIGYGSFLGTNQTGSVLVESQN